MKELTYQVPRQAYANLLADMIRKNDRRPFRVAAALLLAALLALPPACQPRPCC